MNHNYSQIPQNIPPKIYPKNVRNRNLQQSGSDSTTSPKYGQVLSNTYSPYGQSQTTFNFNNHSSAYSYKSSNTTRETFKLGNVLMPVPQIGKIGDSNGFQSKLTLLDDHLKNVKQKREDVRRIRQVASENIVLKQKRYNSEVRRAATEPTILEDPKQVILKGSSDHRESDFQTSDIPDAPDISNLRWCKAQFRNPTTYLPKNDSELTNTTRNLSNKSGVSSDVSAEEPENLNIFEDKNQTVKINPNSTKPAGFSTANFDYTTTHDYQPQTSNESNKTVLDQCIELLSSPEVDSADRDDLFLNLVAEDMVDAIYQIFQKLRSDPNHDLKRYLNVNALTQNHPKNLHAIHIAICKRSMPMLNTLIHGNPEMRIPDDAILHAVHYDFFEAVEFLYQFVEQDQLSYPADPSDSIGNKAKSSMIDIDKICEVQPAHRLIIGSIYRTSDRECNKIFTPGITPLMLAAKNDNYHMIQLILDLQKQFPKTVDPYLTRNEYIKPSEFTPLKLTNKQLLLRIIPDQILGADITNNLAYYQGFHFSRDCRD